MLCIVSSVGSCISVGIQDSSSDSERSAKLDARREKKRGKREAHEARVRQAAVAAERAVEQLERRLMFEGMIEARARAAVVDISGKWIEGGVRCCANCIRKTPDQYHPDHCSLLCDRTFGPLPVTTTLWQGCKSVHYMFTCGECGEEPPVPSPLPSPFPSPFPQKAWAGLGDPESYQREAVEAHWRFKRFEPVQ